MTNSQGFTGRFAGRSVLVTGGGSGIGRAAALAYGREGAMVAVAGRGVDELEETVRRIGEAGGRALAIRCDVAVAGEVEALVARVTAEFGRLDAAFNNAGVEGKFAPIGELSGEDFDHVVGVNLKGVWLSIKYEAAAMKRGGAIVNTASWLADRAVGGSSAYTASKGALLAMTRSLAVELGPQGIRINTILPGIIATPMFDRLGGNDDLSATLAAATPLRRVGEPADVGDVAVWLSSEEARFVTGQNLLVDGGYTITAMP